METQLSRLSQLSSEHRQIRFTSLMHLINEENLKACFWELKRDRAPGVDWVTWAQYREHLDENVSNLYERMRKWQYRPLAVRRLYIPKDNGGKRPLGIPALEDKMVQMMVTKILTAIYEPQFQECSYGFRSKRSAHDALKAVNRELYTRPTSYVIDADIKGFFDHVEHAWLMRFLEHRIADRNFLRLIVRFLNAGVMESGVYYTSEQGTPQGGIVSPVLANVYLHYVLDLWFTRYVKRQLIRYCALIRYADDFIILAQTRATAVRILNLLRARLMKFGLELSEEKTKLIAFGRFARENAERRGEKPATFDFLGFTHYLDKSRNGKFKIGRKTAQKKYCANLRRMNDWLKQVRNRVTTPEIWRILRLKLVGHYRYYGVSENTRSLRKYEREVTQLLFKWLNRRSQRTSFTWEQFESYLKRHPLPRAKIYCNLYDYA